MKDGSEEVLEQLVDGGPSLFRVDDRLLRQRQIEGGRLQRTHDRQHLWGFLIGRVVVVVSGRRRFAKFVVVGGGFALPIEETIAVGEPSEDQMRNSCHIRYKTSEDNDIEALTLTHECTYRKTYANSKRTCTTYVKAGNSTLRLETEF